MAWPSIGQRCGKTEEKLPGTLMPVLRERLRARKRDATGIIFSTCRFLRRTPDTRCKFRRLAKGELIPEALFSWEENRQNKKSKTKNEKRSRARDGDAGASLPGSQWNTGCGLEFRVHAVNHAISPEPPEDGTPNKRTMRGCASAMIVSAMFTLLPSAAIAGPVRGLIRRIAEQQLCHV